MEIVEPPPASSWPSNCLTAALENLAISIPLCWKNLESSVAIKASINTSDTSLYSIFSLFCFPNLANSFPSLSYS